jgi:hypothetical protein
LRNLLETGGRLHEPVPCRLHGYRRTWGVAMNNWEGGEAVKHFVDPGGNRPRVAVAYLDLREQHRGRVNGLAVPVDAGRLEELDRRERNYRRIEVSEALEPRLETRAFVYVGTDAGRARRRRPAAEVVVSSEYLARVRDSFAALGPEALEEFERTTEPMALPERMLERRGGA